MAYSIGLDGTLVNGLPPWITKGWSQGPDFSPLWCAKWRFQPNISFTFPCSKQLNSHCREFWLVEPSFYKVVIDNVASGISMISMDISWDINEFSGYHILSYHIISRDIYIYTYSSGMASSVHNKHCRSASSPSNAGGRVASGNSDRWNFQPRMESLSQSVQTSHGKHHAKTVYLKLL